MVVPPTQNLPQASPEPVADPRRSRAGKALRSLLRARITAGLVVILPLWITYLLLRFLFEFMRDTSLWVVEMWLNMGLGGAWLARWGISEEILRQKGIEAFPRNVQWGIEVFCVFLTVVFVYMVGMFTANIIGKRVIAGMEILLDRLPLVKTVYRATKQILASLAGDAAQNFQRVALVPFPSKEMRSVGFITGITRDRSTGEELCSVFLASTPNPTTGFVFVVPRRDLIELEWTVEEAISLVMSGGVILPPSITLQNNAQETVVATN